MPSLHIMDAELAVNWFSEQFCGRVLADLQSEQLPNIPIADLGDLDINMSSSSPSSPPPPLLNGSLHHWSGSNNNNNNNNEISFEDERENNNWRQNGVLKRPLENGGYVGDGQKETKYQRTFLSADETSLTYVTDDLDIMDTVLPPVSSLTERHARRDLNTRFKRYVGNTNTSDPPTATVGSYDNNGSAKGLLRTSADGCAFSRDVWDGERNGYEEETITVMKEAGASSKLDTNQQVLMHMSPASAEGSRHSDSSACDNKDDSLLSLPPVMESKNLQLQPPHLLPAGEGEGGAGGGTTESSRDYPNSCPDEGESIEPIKEEQSLQEEKQETQQQQQQNEEIKTQKFLDWAMENLLKSADSLLELQTAGAEEPELPSSNSEPEPVAELIAQNVPNRNDSKDQSHKSHKDETQGTVLSETGSNHSLQPPSSSLSSSSYTGRSQKKTPHIGSIYVQKCVSCDLCFRNDDDFLTHLKDSHSNEQDCFQCPHCSARLEDLQLLEDHMKVHSLISNISTEEEHLETCSAVHEMVDDGDDVVEFISCEICHALFHTKENLLEHRLKSHNKMGEATPQPDFLPRVENKTVQSEMSQKELSYNTKVHQEDNHHSFNDNHSVDAYVTHDQVPYVESETTQNDVHSQITEPPLDGIIAVSQSLRTNSEKDLSSSRDPTREISHCVNQEENADNTGNKNEKLNSAAYIGLIGDSQNSNHRNANKARNNSNLHQEPTSDQLHHGVDNKEGSNFSEFTSSFDPENDDDKFQTGNKRKSTSELTAEDAPENKGHFSAATTSACKSSDSKDSLPETPGRGQGQRQGCAGDLIKQISSTKNVIDEDTAVTSELQNGDVSLSKDLISNSVEHDDRHVLLCNKTISVTEAISKLSDSVAMGDNDVVAMDTSEVPDEGPFQADTPETQRQENAQQHENAQQQQQQQQHATSQNNKSPAIAAVSPSRVAANYISAFDLCPAAAETQTASDEVFMKTAGNATPAKEFNLQLREDLSDDVQHSSNSTDNPAPSDTTNDDDFVKPSGAPILPKWVQIMESTTVIPPHMPNYSTYKCLICGFSFMTEAVLKTHCDGHDASATKPVKKRKSKGAKKKRSRSKGDRTSKTKSGNQKADANMVEGVNNIAIKADNQNTQPAIVSYTESDQDDNDDERNDDKGSDIKTPNVVNNTLWSKHVQLFQEYL